MSEGTCDYLNQWARDSFTDKVVLITGANNPYGIGAGTARAFAALGAKIAISYLSLPREHPSDFQDESDTIFGTAFYGLQRSKSADEVVSSVRGSGGIIAAFESDFNEPGSSKKLFDWAEETFGPVDILINSAAHCEPSGDTILSVTTDMIDQTLCVNVRAMVLLIQEFASRHKHRAATFGRIVNLSTDAAQAFASQIIYGASKAAIEALTRSIAIELGPLGITINAIAPGPTQTGYISPEAEARLLPEIPGGRLGTPNDIAHAILFLSSRQSGWITGQIVRVAGGHVV